jgi:hypothetical protein
VRTTITYRALSAWPNNVPATTYNNRKRSPFRSAWASTLADLDRELQQIGARSVVIEIDAPASEIRRDGMPRADARTRSPGVILSYEKRRRGAGDTWDRYVYPCDTFHDWQDNVRAIAKTLEALRAVDRYGVTRDGQQFASFKSLPPGDGVRGTTREAAGMSLENAARVLSDLGGLAFDVEDYNQARVAFRTARAKTHPDAGGKASDFQAVNAAGERLAAHFGQPL